MDPDIPREVRSDLSAMGFDAQRAAEVAAKRETRLPNGQVPKEGESAGQQLGQGRTTREGGAGRARVEKGGARGRAEKGKGYEGLVVGGDEGEFTDCGEGEDVAGLTADRLGSV